MTTSHVLTELQDLHSNFLYNAQLNIDKSFLLGGLEVSPEQRHISENLQGRYIAYTIAAEEVLELINAIRRSGNDEARYVTECSGCGNDVISGQD